MKKAGKALLGVLAALLLVVGAYVVYVLTDYHRIGDQSFTVSGSGAAQAETETVYTLVSYNIGFAAYTPDFGFFMDGGTESRAASRESVETVTGEIADFLREQEADFVMVQEVDTDATRSHHVDERAILEQGLGDYVCTFAQNYDSPYLFYPILEPIGKSQSGLLTASRFAVTESLRRELPVEESLYKLLDLDRCYAVNRVPVAGGRELVLYTVHLSAYTSDGTVATEQLRLLLADMQSEYEKGNYAVCGGDFNKDLLGDSAATFGVSGEGQTWAQPFPEELLEGTDISLAAFEEGIAPSSRNADGPYHEGQFVLVLDGFLVSANVTAEPAEVLDTGFAWSDHNPVRLHFTLRG